MTDSTKTLELDLRKQQGHAVTPPACKKWVSVAFAMNFTFYPKRIPARYRSCWGYTRPRPGGGAPKRCEWDRDALGLWAYNEIDSSPSMIKRDLASLRASHAWVDAKTPTTYGFLYYAYSATKRHWETRGHVPSGIGHYWKLLELYQHRDVVTGHAFTDWYSRYRGSFGAMVNIGAPAASHATVANWVAKVCDATQTGVMGLYAGAGERALFTQAQWQARLTSVWKALDSCTRRS